MKVAHTNSVAGAHIKLGDKAKCPDTQAVYHSIMLVLPTGNKRIIYFKQIHTQTYVLSRLLALQGFSNQIEQYELQPKPLQRGNICTVTPAKHKVTGTDVVVKTVNKAKLEESGRV